MNRQTGIGIIIGAAAVTAIGAVAGYRMYEAANYAEVIAVKPAMTTVNVPREECREVVVEKQSPTKDPKQVTGTVAGAVIGGLLGSQIGGGTGKKVATVGGAVAGGYAGNKVQEGMQERNTYQEVQQDCQTVYDSHEEQVGFDVSYRLQGVEKMVRMDHDPGERIPVENGELVLE
ncbi:MAG TPA: glycine zipper 2TM domain-containing protein [Xanthomonadales bacterium]|nr:glycine zipper 2TM domain-containing protein [Xanthomonadales bacterium]